MQEILDQIYGYIRGIWRRRWPMILIAWLVCMAGWPFVLQMPDQYSASARIHVDTRSMLGPLMRGLAAQTNLGQEVALVTRTLLSRPNMERLARMTDLDLRANNPAAMESMLDSLKNRINLASTRNENIYTISFSDSDPQLAKKVVDSLLTIFVESSLGSSRKDTDTAQRFLNEQIAEYEQRLIEAEDRLKEFKRHNVGIMPGQGQDYYGRLQTATAQLNEAKLQLKEATNRRNELQFQLEDAEMDLEGGMLYDAPTLGGGSSPLDARIQALQARLDELLLNYTDKHPDVVAVQTTIDNLRAQKEAEAAAMAGQGDSGMSSTVGQNPIVQQLKIALGEAEAVVASLQVRVDEYGRRVKQLEDMVDTIPQVEAQLKNLNRDYEIVKKSYESLLSRRESAMMAERVDATGDGVKFRIIDPARVPLEPTGPNRTLYMGIVLLAGLGAGLGVAFLLSQIRSTFDDRNMLRNATDLPVLGTISMEWTPAQRVKMRVEVVVFTVLTISLILAYGLVVLFQDQGAGLLALLK